MDLGDQLQKLNDLRRQGALSDEEFAVAKQKLLGEPPSRFGNEQLDDLSLQNELLQLDRAWEMERENYMVTGRYGQRYIPDKATIIPGSLMVIAGGSLWTVMAVTIGGFGQRGAFSLAFPLFGVIFVLVGIWSSVNAFSKAGQYQQAFDNYQGRRQELLSRR
ncbi:MAG: SHOCT domain-containing protein [Aureliella sp.]